jgi:hypothetical protein
MCIPLVYLSLLRFIVNGRNFSLPVRLLPSSARLFIRLTLMKPGIRLFLAVSARLLLRRGVLMRGGARQSSASRSSRIRGSARKRRRQVLRNFAGAMARIAQTFAS